MPAMVPGLRMTGLAGGASCLAVVTMLLGASPVVGQSYEEMAGPWDPVVSPIPLKLDRPPNLSDTAKVALFLACDDSAYMSGVCLPATDGGTLSRVAIWFEEDLNPTAP